MAAVLSLGSLSRATFLLLLVAHLWGSTVRAQDLITDDEVLVSKIETEANALIRNLKTVKLKALRDALAKAKTVPLTLVTTGTADLPPADLFTQQARGVLVVGVFSKPKKKARYEMAGCTGFALTADGVFATNYHVVDNPEGEVMVVATRDGAVTPVTEVLAADKLADVAILRAPGAIFTPLALAAEPPPTGAAVWAISHPDHNFYSFTSGMVSRHFLATTEFGRTPQMAITADFGAGSSGGPILDRHGAVVGMVCSTTSVYWEDAKAKINDLQMVFKHCVPVQSIRRLITAPEKTP